MRSPEQLCTGMAAAVIALGAQLDGGARKPSGRVKRAASERELVTQEVSDRLELNRRGSVAR